jgi:hypothetical protein
MLTPSGFPNGATCTDRGASAAPDTSAKSGIGIIDLPGPLGSKFVSEAAAMYHELRKQALGRFRKAMSQLVASASRGFLDVALRRRFLFNE